MSVKLGMEAKLYRNAGTYEAPDWVEITNVKDVTLTLSTGEANVTTRANNGWKATKATLKDGSVDFDMIWDAADEGFAAIRSAFFGNTSIELAIMDGDMETEGSEGLRATFSVTKFDRKEPLEEAITVAVSVKPTYSAHAPEWMSAAGGGVRLSFDVALVAGVGSIDLTALPYGDGAYDATGKKVTELQISNAGANALTVTKAVANGYDLFGSNDPIVIPAAGSVRLAGATGVAVAADKKLLTLAGTLVQTSTWTILLE
jgi:hypothetical protein